MLKSVITSDGRKIVYDLQIKKVKNVNVRIKPDGMVYVSANKRVPIKFIDDFVVSKADFVFEVLEKFSSEVELKQYFTESQLKDFILQFCKIIYPYYEALGIKYPVIKFRKMTSRWGSCNSSKGIITFNTQLMYAPTECVEYVVWHEFTHFLQPNHSKYFYMELEKVCPDWKLLRKELKGISV